MFWGGFVRSCLNEGCFAIGIEGSDYSKKHARAEWALLSDRFLFTADLTHPFEVKDEKTVHFDLITAWEVLEHIEEGKLPQVCENIKKHLLPTGIVVVSISSAEELVQGFRLHQTVKKKEWWVDFFADQGLFHLPPLERYFNTQYVRGKKQNAPQSFHLILSQDPSQAPKAARLSLKEWLVDKWLFSKPQKFLKKIIIGF